MTGTRPSRAPQPSGPRGQRPRWASMGSCRVAFLSEHASPVALRGGEDAGGQNVYVDEVSRNLASLGYEVDIFTRRDSRDVPEIIDWVPGVRVVNLTAGPPS